jgi:hypothetical protein
MTGMGAQSGQSNCRFEFNPEITVFMHTLNESVTLFWKSQR